MKDLGESTQILGMRIFKDNSTGMSKLSQEDYILKVLKRFSVGDAKPRNSPLSSYLKSTREHSPTTEAEKEQSPLFPMLRLLVA